MKQKKTGFCITTNEQGLLGADADAAAPEAWRACSYLPLSVMHWLLREKAWTKKLRKSLTDHEIYNFFVLCTNSRYHESAAVLLVLE